MDGRQGGDWCGMEGSGELGQARSVRASYGAKRLAWQGVEGSAGEVRQGSEEHVKEGRVEVRCGRRGKDGVNRRGGRVEAKQAWLGAVWMESKGQAGFSRHGYWHGG